MNTFEIAKITGSKHEVILRQVKKFFKGNPNVVEGVAHHDSNNQTFFYFELPDFELVFYATAMIDVKLAQKIILTTCLFNGRNDSWDAMLGTLDLNCKDNFNQLKARHRLLCARVENKLIQLDLYPKDFEVMIKIENEFLTGYELPPELNFVFAQGLLKNRKQLIQHLAF